MSPYSPKIPKAASLAHALVIMSTCTKPGLEKLLGELGLPIPIPSFSGAKPLIRPIDIWRSYLADTTSRLLECDARLAYEEAVQNANSKDDTALVVILPRLKLKTERKPQELAKELIFKVEYGLSPWRLMVNLARCYSINQRHCFPSRPPTEPSFDSFSLRWRYLESSFPTSMIACRDMDWTQA